MKSKEEILTEYGCSEIPFDENVTMYYPALLNAMDEYAQQEANTNSLLQKIEADLGDTKRLFLLWHDGGEWILSLDSDSKQSKTLAELIKHN